MRKRRHNRTGRLHLDRAVIRRNKKEFRGSERPLKDEASKCLFPLPEGKTQHDGSKHWSKRCTSKGTEIRYIGNIPIKFCKEHVKLWDREFKRALNNFR